MSQGRNGVTDCRGACKGQRKLTEIELGEPISSIKASLDSENSSSFNNMSNFDIFIRSLCHLLGAQRR